MNRRKTNKLFFPEALHKGVLFLLILSGFCSQAQNINASQPLRTVLTDLEFRLNISFTYVDETVGQINLVPPADTLNIDQILTYLRTETGLSFHQLDARFIAISKSDDEFINVCGYLADEIDQSPLVGATIQVANRFTVTDENGLFNITNVSLSSPMYVRMLGYQSAHFMAKDMARITPCTTFSLKIDATQLQAVMVHNYLTTGISKQLNGAFEVEISELGLLPGLTEPDVLQTIQTLPGVQSINETVSDINVRGGTNDQNLVLWDGIKMYQTGHFFGLISAFNPFLSKSVTLIKNGTTAALSDGVSSVIDIRSKDNHATQFSGGAGINMINADVFFRIPLAKKLTLQLSGRRSITDLIKTPMFNNYFERAFGNTEVTQQSPVGSDTTINSDENFYFYDIGADLIYDITKKDKLRIHFLTLFNELDYQENITSKI